MGLWWALALAALALSTGCCRKRKAKKQDSEREGIKSGRKHHAVVKAGNVIGRIRAKAGNAVHRTKAGDVRTQTATPSRTDERPTTGTGTTRTTGSASQTSLDSAADSSTRRSERTTHRSIATARFRYGPRPPPPEHRQQARLPYAWAEGGYRGLKPGTRLEEDVEVLVDPPASPMLASERYRRLDAATASQRQRDCAARLQAFVRALPDKA